MLFFFQFEFKYTFEELSEFIMTAKCFFANDELSQLCCA